MATASVTNTFVDATIAEASEVNTNFSDLVTFLNGSVVHVDGSKAMTGALTLAAAGITFPTAAITITNVLDDDTMATASATTIATSESIKAYADTQDATKLSLSGGTMTGILVLDNLGVTFPTSGITIDDVLDEDNMASDSAVKLATQQSIKAYADLMLPLTGGTMSGAIAMGTSKITGLGDGSAAQDAATVSQVKNLVWHEMAFSKPAGDVSVETGTYRYYNRSGNARTIQQVSAMVGTAPTGATLIVDVNVDGTSLWATTTANRPTIAISGFVADGGAQDTSAWANGSYITVDVDQVGSTVAGADLTVIVYFTEDD